MTFQFDPPDGFRNTSIFPQKPSSEMDFRDQMMRPLEQMASYLNLEVEKKSVLVSYNGATTKFINQSTTLYVSTDSAVSTGYDGLSSDKPIRLSDIETIFKALKLEFPVLLGNWKIKMAAGFYQSDGNGHMLFLDGIDSVEWIEFSGEDVSVSQIPTTVLDGKINGKTYAHGLYFQNMNVKVSNIKVQNFTEGTNANIPTGTRGGVVFSGIKGRVWTYNVHAYNCSWGGVLNQGVPRMYVQGGLFEANRQGVVAMFNVQVSIGYGGSDLRPDAENTRFIGNLEVGCLLQSQVNGHVDYCIFDGNTNKSLTVVTSSEVNAVKNKFRNNNFAISVQSNSRVLDSGNTFTDNNQDFDLFYSGYIQRTENSDADNRRREISQLMDTSSKYFTVTAPSGGGVFFSQILPPSSLYGRGKTLDVVIYGRISNVSFNTSNILVKADDGINPIVTVQTIAIPTNGAYQNFKFEFLFSNYTKSSFTYNSDFFVQSTGMIITNLNGLLLDSTKKITITIELVVNGTAASSGLNTYRILPKVVF